MIQIVLLVKHVISQFNANLHLLNPIFALRMFFFLSRLIGCFRSMFVPLDFISLSCWWVETSLSKLVDGVRRMVLLVIGYGMISSVVKSNDVRFSISMYMNSWRNSFHVSERNKFDSGVIKQHQCLTVHPSLSTASLLMQYTIRKIPLCDPLQFVLYWLIEEGEDNQTHVLVSCMIESKFPLFSNTVCLIDSLSFRFRHSSRRKHRRCVHVGCK